MREQVTEQQVACQAAVVGMYSAHPSPSFKDKIAFASRRMPLRLYCCGIEKDDYVGKKLLDAGCGTGEYSSWFASRGAQVTGIDLSDGSLREARAYVDSLSLDNVGFEKRSVLDTGFADATFDFVYCTGVLHHTPDPFGGLRELIRVLRPGGKILISLYTSSGFLLREARRQVAKAMGGEDLQQRVMWGRRLFPLTTRRLIRGERNDPQSPLYDYFGIPHETLHSIGQVLGWFDRLGLEYTGTFPPARIGDYPAMFRHRDYSSVETEFHSRFGEAFCLFTKSATLTPKRPGALARALVQSLWFFGRIGVFSIAARKPEVNSVSSPSQRPAQYQEALQNQHPAY
jgi:2-polyprenyl-3-methyl-5-hydroxy-6-metoxy-1,4-benzoquinol methylase